MGLTNSNEPQVDLVDVARLGAPAGEATSCLFDDGALQVQFVTRPAVGMAFLTGVPYAAALGVADALTALGASGVGVAWPHDVCGPDGILASVNSSAGYGEGMFVVCRATLDGVDAEHAEALADAIVEHGMARVNAWAKGIVSAGKSATPLGPVLNEYFDRMPLMGKDVEVVYPNGNVAMRATLVGMDIWGKATVKNEFGKELEIAPEQAGLRPVSE